MANVSRRRPGAKPVASTRPHQPGRRQRKPSLPETTRSVRHKRTRPTAADAPCPQIQPRSTTPARKLTHLPHLSLASPHRSPKIHPDGRGQQHAQPHHQLIQSPKRKRGASSPPQSTPTPRHHTTPRPPPPTNRHPPPPLLPRRLHDPPRHLRSCRSHPRPAPRVGRLRLGPPAVHTAPQPLRTPRRPHPGRRRPPGPPHPPAPGHQRQPPRARKLPRVPPQGRQRTAGQSSHPTETADPAAIAPTSQPAARPTAAPSPARQAARASGPDPDACPRSPRRPRSAQSAPGRRRTAAPQPR